jgi:hypothetical protein
VTRSVKREPSICIQRPRVDSGRTKRRRSPRVNPRVHSRFLAPRHAPQLASRRHRHGSSRRCARRRWVDAPPSSGSSAEPYPHTTASELPRSLVDERRGGGWRRRDPLIGARARRWVDAPPSSGSSAGPYPHNHGGSRARCRERRLEIYPRGSQIRGRRWFVR